MAIVGIGVDLVNVRRIEELIERWHDRFLAKIFTDAERRLLRARTKPFASYAGRFAAKEAAFKALGTGWAKGVSWHDIEVLADAAGKPLMTVHGTARQLMDQAGATAVFVSLAHDTDYAVAQVILTNDPGPPLR